MCSGAVVLLQEGEKTGCGVANTQDLCIFVDMESIPTDNARLTAAIRDGSREAFDEMCGRYYAPLMAYARLFLKGNWAQDIVQDVFVNVWIRRETLDPRQSLYGYLLRSVYNQSVNYVNKNRHAGNYRSYHQERIEIGRASCRERV